MKRASIEFSPEALPHRLFEVHMDLLLSVVFSIVVIGFPVLAIVLNFLAHQEPGRARPALPELKRSPFVTGSTQCDVLQTQAHS